MRYLGKFLLLFVILVSAGCELYTQQGVPEESAQKAGGVGVAVMDALSETFSVDVERLPATAEDSFYAVWRWDSGTNAFSLLGFISVDENGRGQLSGSLSKAEIDATRIVFVTLEKGATPAAPSSDIVLTASNEVSADVINLKLEPPAAEAEEVPAEVTGQVTAEESEVEVPELVEGIVEQPAEAVVPEVIIVPEEVLPEEAAMVPEEKPAEEAIVIIVEETELVQLKTEATDPDGDPLIYSFTTPLDSTGKWQTTYGDEGEYTATITVSDGSLSTVQDVLVIVNKKEESPVIESFNPHTLAVSADENTEMAFNVEASDVNGDFLSYNWLLDGTNVGTSTEYVYPISYADFCAHTVKADVSDGALSAEQIWSVTVNNVNRLPIVESIAPITVKETETVNLDVVASDPDGDALEITISDPVGDDGVWETTYDDSGKYDVKVTVSDGTDSVSTDVKITVENVNRAPVIRDIVKG